jgi:signal transduction histidine kinase
MKTQCVVFIGEPRENLSFRAAAPRPALQSTILARRTTPDKLAFTAVDVVSESFVNDLPDEHRTCVLGIVQEAVRNAARHSGARPVSVYVKERNGKLVAIGSG